MSSLSVDRDGAIASCSTSRSAGAFSTMARQSPTTSIKSAGPRIGSTTKLEEDAGTNKSGMVVGFLAFTKSTKKMYYAVLSDRCFVLHENQKSYKKKKAARHIFDLATCFNVNRHEDAKLKTCVSIMTPDETFIFKAVDEDKPRDDTATLDWYDAMMTVVVPARALFLGRPVLATEFFEYCWDVFLVSKPRIRKPTPNPENFENICAKRPELATRHRLGFYAHTIILCKMGTQPALSGHPKSGIPPFKTESFIEIQRQFVASFGFQEKYFIMRIGRAAATGMCEIWAQCESEEVAISIHNRLNEIIEREAEKKRQQQATSGANPNHQMIGGSSQTSTNNFCEVSSFLKAETREGSLPAVGSSSSLSSKKGTLRRNNLMSMEEEDEMAPHLATQKVVFNRSTISAKSIDQAVLRDITRHEQKSAETQTRAHTIGEKSSSTSSWFNLLKRGSQKKEEKPKTFPTLNPMEWGKHRMSLVSGSSAADDETEDSGGTLKVVDYEETDVKREQPILVNGMYPHEMLIETAFDNHSDLFCGSGQRGSISSSSDHSGDFGRRKRQMTVGSDSGKDDSSSINADESSLSDVMGGCPRHFDEVCSTSSSLSADHPDQPCECTSSAAHMLTPPTAETHQEDGRSCISDSSDSCYSSLPATLNPPRAQSFSTNLRMPNYEMMQSSKFPTFQYSKDLRRLDEAGSLLSTASTDGMQLGEEAATTAPISKTVRIQENPSSQFLNPKDDLRKRAFSLGSKSWIMKPFRKLSQQNAKSNSGSKSSSIAGDSENDCNESVASHRSHPETTRTHEIYAEMHGRSDSIDSAHSQHLNGRKPSSILKKRGPNDLVEVNFSPPSSQTSIVAQYNNIGTHCHSSNSVDSPVRSRASSFATRRSNNSGKNSICGDVRKSVDQEEPIVEVYEPMQQVRCFIQAGDDDIINVLSCKDTTSLHSLKNDINHFETIEENGSPPPSRASSRLSRRSLEPKSPTEADVGFKYRKEKEKTRDFKLQPPMEEISYAVIAPLKPADRKLMSTTTRTQKEPTL